MINLLKLLKPLVEKFPNISELYRLLRDAKKLRKPVIYREALNFKFNGAADMENGMFEPSESLIFDRLIDKFDLFINIGANTGYYVLKALYNEKNVLAFEPVEHNVKMLLRNINENHFSSECSIIPIALGNKKGVLPIYGASTGASLISGWAGQKNYKLVPINTFDSIGSSMIKDKNCLVIIDIEGAELSCLKGAESLLSSNCNNVFMVEICIEEHQPKGISINPNLLQTFKLFFSFSYSAYTVDANFRKVNLEEIDKIVKTGEDTLGIHNFLFIKNEMSLSDFGI